MAVRTIDSAGYNGLMNTPLARPDYHDAIMVRVEERDFLSEITNTDIAERIESCGQVIQIMKAPPGAPWRTYNLNQPMVSGQVAIGSVCLSVCNAAYTSYKFDDLTIHNAQKFWGKFEESFLAGSYEEFVSFQREWVFGRMIASVAPKNRGSNAGRKRNLDLGRLGAPKIVTRSSIALEFALLRQVLSEEFKTGTGLWIVVPHEIITVMVNSNFANSAWVGDSAVSLNVDGVWKHTIMGFNIFESIHLPSVTENNLVCYHILAGHKDAFTYAANIIRTRIVPGYDSFSVLYQMLAVWGGAALYPNYLALGYWAFDPYN
jgi:hypothetical protein